MPKERSVVLRRRYADALDPQDHRTPTRTRDIVTLWATTESERVVRMLDHFDRLALPASLWPALVDLHRTSRAEEIATLLEALRREVDLVAVAERFDPAVRKHIVEIARKSTASFQERARAASAANWAAPIGVGALATHLTLAGLPWVAPLAILFGVAAGVKFHSLSKAMEQAEKTVDYICNEMGSE